MKPFDTPTKSNDTLTTLNVASFSAVDLELNTNSLAALDTSTNVSGTLDITTTEVTFDLDTSALTVLFTGSATGTLDLTTDTTTALTSNVQTLDLTATSTMTVQGSNYSDINGTAQGLTLNSNITGTLTTDLSVTNTLSIADNIVTTIDISGANTINTVNIDSSSVSIINTNSVAITTLAVIQATNNTTINTAVEDLDLSSTGAAVLTVNYSGTNQLVVDINTFGSLITYTNVNLNLPSATSLDVSGQATNLTITGTSLDTLDTAQLGATTFTMNSTTFTDLSFVSNDLIGSVTTLEVDTLSNVNIEDILGVIDGTTVDLISPIIDADVYNYYYDTELAALTAQEGIDNLRYDGFRQDAIDAAWAEILLNEFMAHLDETTTKAEIDAQTYQTAADYFTSYLANEGISEVDYETANGAGSADTARSSIQSTLDDPLLTIVELDLQNQVTASIETDATTYATTEQTNDTFTLS